MDANLIVLIIVAVLGSGGIGAVISSITRSVRMARSGISGREAQRQNDIIAQRDIAWVRVKLAEEAADAAEAIADVERRYRIAWMEHATRLRIQLILAHLEPLEDPPAEPTPPQKKETE